MQTQKLYRAVSKAEFDDWEKTKIFRTAINTIEAKQFFKSEAAVKDFLYHSQLRKFSPAYSIIFELEILNECIKNINTYITELDRFEAVTINEVDLIAFNKCINFIHYYAC